MRLSCLSLSLLVLSTCCLLRPSISRSIVSRRFCDAGQFLDVQRDACRNCSTTCPENQIIRRTCSAVTDSVCGPFFEFQPQHEDAEKNRAMQRQRWHQLLKQQWSLRRRMETDWPMSTNDTDTEYSSPLTSLPPRPAAEPEIEHLQQCSATVGCLAILISASVLCVVVVGMAVLLLSRRFLQGRKSLSGAMPGAEGGGQLIAEYFVAFPHVVSSSVSGSVDRRVKHLELQLHRNWQRRAGGMTSGSQPIGSNDYMNEKLRKTLLLNANTAI